MAQSKSKYEFYQQASLSQKLADKYPLFQKLAGSDRDLSDSIAVLSYLGEQGMLETEDTDFIIGLLDVLRMSRFATSEKVNEITKMGMMMPKGEDIISDFNEE